MSDYGRQPPRVVGPNDWGLGEDLPGPRRGVPLLGLFLIALGVLLALGELVPGAQVGAPAFFLVIGVLLLLLWARDRSHAALYAGVFVTALSLSALLSAAGAISGPGWGTLFLGIGFLGIAAIRAAGHGGWGWQMLLGGLLVVSGGSEVAAATAGFNANDLVGPILIVLLGLLIVTRSSGRRPY